MICHDDLASGPFLYAFNAWKGLCHKYEDVYLVFDYKPFDVFGSLCHYGL